MTNLDQYYRSGKWLSLFHEAEQGEVLNFWYSMFKWLERDNADELLLLPNEFIWNKNGNVVGRFPIRVTEPNPSFHNQLLLILNRDAIIQEHLIPTDDENRFKFIID
ncbi:MAG: hypothetical protein GC179_06135 [Anaerolineaceae bacterium]|nr:hypothetical protein [Anaerolineaceae bacterium]